MGSWSVLLQRIRVCHGVQNHCQSLPSVYFAYNLQMPNHTLGNVNIGYGLAATPEPEKVVDTTIQKFMLSY